MVRPTRPLGRLMRSLVLLSALLSAGTAAAQSQPARRPLVLARATDVVSQWQQDQHLYVKGSVGPGPEELETLEAWLDENATNWTVILVESASGERFVDSTGKAYADIDAVDSAVGFGLSSLRAFSQLVDSRTRERNGAIFVLYLAERKLSFYASDAFDRRSLGEANWIGELDQAAIAAMRSGGRVVDAAIDTITSINRKLDAKVADELLAKARETEKARAAVINSAGTLKLLETAATAFALSHPGLTGDIARPPLPQLRADVASAEAALAAGDLQKAALIATPAGETAGRLLRMISEYPGARARIDAVAHALDAQESRARAASAAGELNNAWKSLAAARRDYDSGNSAFSAHLADAEQAKDAAAAMISSAERAAFYLYALAIFFLAAAISAAALVAWALNRRRRGAMHKANELIRSWRTALDEKTAAVFKLLQRAHDLIGASADEASQRYTGSSLVVAQEIIRNVDELFIMASCAGRVLRDAQRLVEPAGRMDRVRNLFSRRSYDDAARLLGETPITFEPEEGLELVIRGPRDERDSLLGSLSSYAPFAMSFEKLLLEFNLRADQSLAATDRIEHAVLNVDSLLHEARRKYDETLGAVERVAEDATEDGIFPCRSLRDSLLPEASARIGEAKELSFRDPLAAVRLTNEVTEPLLAGAASLLQIATDYRSRLLPEIEKAADLLEGHEVATAWIGGELGRLSDEHESIGAEAAVSLAGERVSSVRSSLEHLSSSVAEAVQLDLRRREDSQKLVDLADSSVGAARKRIAGALGRDPVDALRESGMDPSERVAKALSQVAASKAALDRGDTAAAAGCLDSCDAFAAEASSITESTIKAFENHQAAVDAIKARAKSLVDSLPRHQSLLDRIHGQYAPSVLALRAGDPAHPNANGTVADNMQEARGYMEEADEALTRAGQLHQDLRILEAAATLDRVRGLHELAGHRLREIVEKDDRLAAAEAANTSAAAALAEQARSVESELDEPRTGERARELHSAFRASHEQVRGMSQTPGSDPFKTGDSISEARRALDEIQARIESDRELHAEAERSVRQAVRQHQAASQLARQTLSDSAGDSTETVDARRQVDGLAAAVAGIEAALKKPHQDWAALDVEADRVASEAARLAALLQGQLQEAQAVLTALMNAAAAARRAGGWTGSHGVRISGSAGAEMLDRAREMLQRGAYRDAMMSAESARRASDAAVAEAEARVAQIRRQEQEKAERERRRRAEAEATRRAAAAPRSSWSTPSRSSSSRSSFSIGSGTSRSSFTRSSGVSRSGW